MLIGAAFVGVHMALTHGVTLGMVASYIPATEVEGIGRITGTCWSFTDFIFGEPNKPVSSCAACWSLGIAVCLKEAAPPKPVLTEDRPVIRGLSCRGIWVPNGKAQPFMLHRAHFDILRP